MPLTCGREDEMGEAQRTTKIIKVTDVRQHLGELLNQVFRRETRVLVEKSGIPVAAIVSPDDLRRLDQLDQERAERFQVIDELRAAFKDVPPEELEREAARAVAEVRTERRAERERAALPR